MSMMLRTRLLGGRLGGFTSMTRKLSHPCQSHQGARNVLPPDNLCSKPNTAGTIRTYTCYSYDRKNPVSTWTGVLEKVLAVPSGCRHLPFLEFDSDDDVLEVLAECDFKSATPALMDVVEDSLDFFNRDPDPITFQPGLSLRDRDVERGSLNNFDPYYKYENEDEDEDDDTHSFDPTPPKKILSMRMRKITVVLDTGRYKSFDALVLGRLLVDSTETFWVVFLDEDKNVLALQANALDPIDMRDSKAWHRFVDERKEGEEWDDFENHLHQPPEFQQKKDLFGAGVVVTKLCSLASLRESIKSKHPLPPPEPDYTVKSWTSTHSYLPGSEEELTHMRDFSN